MPVEMLDVQIGVSAEDEVRIDDMAETEADIAAGSVREIMLYAQIQEQNGIRRLRKRNEPFERGVAALLVGADDGLHLRLPEHTFLRRGGSRAGDRDGGQGRGFPQMPRELAPAKPSETGGVGRKRCPRPRLARSCPRIHAPNPSHATARYGA
jgi:hypothetical protein